jgi:hypothetical protein
MSNEYFPTWDTILATDLVDSGVLIRTQPAADDDEDPLYELSEAGKETGRNMLDKLYQCKFNGGLCCLHHTVPFHLT